MIPHDYVPEFKRRLNKRSAMIALIQDGVAIVSICVAIVIVVFMIHALFM